MTNTIERPAFVAAAPFFILGAPRSGTTLLGSMLGAHPDIAVTPETHFLQLLADTAMQGDLRADAIWNTLVYRVIEHDSFREMSLDPRQFRERAARAPRERLALLRLLLEANAEQQGVRFSGEKTPEHSLEVDELSRAFPDAKFVEIVRDPRAVVASLMKVPWAKRSVASNAEYALRHVTEVRRVEDAIRARLHTLRYEDLVQSPERELRRICGFFGTDFHPRMLEHEAHRRWSIDVNRQPWIAGATKPLRRDGEDGWRAQLRPGEVLQVEVISVVAMQRFGYEMVTPLPRLRLISAAWAARDAAVATGAVLTTLVRRTLRTARRATGLSRPETERDLQRLYRGHHDRLLAAGLTVSATEGGLMMSPQQAATLSTWEFHDESWERIQRRLVGRGLKEAVTPEGPQMATDITTHDTSIVAEVPASGAFTLRALNTTGDSVQWTDFRWDFVMHRRSAFRELSFSIRRANHDDMLCFRLEDDRIHLDILGVGVSRPTLATAPCRCDVGTSSRWRIECRGNVIACYVNDELRISWSEDRRPVGGVGISLVDPDGKNAIAVTFESMSIRAVR